MDFQLWDSTLYSGDLKEYSYPCDKEFGDLLFFLKRIKTNKKIHLTDITKWEMTYLPTEYDIYIICSFGEFVNENFLNLIDKYLKDK